MSRRIPQVPGDESWVAVGWLGTTSHWEVRPPQQLGSLEALGVQTQRLLKCWGSMVSPFLAWWPLQACCFGLHSSPDTFFKISYLWSSDWTEWQMSYAPSLLSLLFLIFFCYSRDQRLMHWLQTGLEVRTPSPQLTFHSAIANIPYFKPSSLKVSGSIHLLRKSCYSNIRPLSHLRVCPCSVPCQSQNMEEYLWEISTTRNKSKRSQNLRMTRVGFSTSLI